MRRTSTISIHFIIWLLTAVLFSSFFILETNINGSKIMMLIIAMVLGLSSIADESGMQIKIGTFQRMQIPFIFYCLASMLWANNKDYSLEKAITLASIVLCMTVLYSYYSRFDSIDSLLKVVMYSGFFTMIYAYFYFGISYIYQVLASGGRIPSAFTNTNTLGMLAAIASVIAVYYILFRRKKWLIVLIIPAVILIAGTGSRKALILLIVGCTLVAMSNSKTQNIAKKIAYALFIFVAALVILYFMSKLSIFEGINHRIEGMINVFTGEGEIDTSAQLRQNYITMGMEQFSKTPILGIGIGNSKILAYEQLGHNAYLHNNFVELLCGGGLVGFILYYLNYFYLIINTLRYRKQESRVSVIVLTLVASLLLIDYGSVSYYSKETYFYFMIFYIFVERQKEQQIRLED